MSRAIDKPLDDADPIDQSYCLEVSSPGVERELTRDAHFEACVGEGENIFPMIPAGATIDKIFMDKDFTQL